LVKPIGGRLETKLRKDARSIFDAALRAADPIEAVRQAMKLEGDTLTVRKRRYKLLTFERIWVIGAGKASATMAQAVERTLGARIGGGLVVTKYGHGARLKRVQVHEAGHPVPDAVGVLGALRLMRMAAEAGGRDLVIFLISGGASALTPSPADPITLEEKQATTKLLLSCGANIHEINTVRKHVSSFKGGQLARLAAPATVITLALSDVIGDNLESIGSGPTVPDPTTFDGAASILRKYDLLRRVPETVRKRIEAGVRGDVPDTPDWSDPCFRKTQTLIVGSNRLAVDAAADRARELGYRTLVLSTSIEGETRDVARMHAAILREIHEAGRPVARPACVLSGGETTVTLKGAGLGGRNQEFALAAAIEIAGMPGVCVLSGGTDGTDGPTDAAGAIATGHSMPRGLDLDMSASDHLARNDSYHYFEALGDLIKTGPTRTNVMDVRVLLSARP
jgi:hydroxypyruvate reductase